MDYIIVALFQILGTAAIIAEIIVPSFGLLTVTSLSLFAYSYYALYHSHPTYIPLLILINLLSIPITLIMGVKILSKSSVTLKTGVEKEKNEPFSGCSVGDVGVALTDLRPSGKAKIEGEVYDVSTTGDYIDKGLRVTVYEKNGRKIKVSLTNQ